MLTKGNICAVIVSHKPGKDFIENLESVKKQVAKVVVVSNGSSFFKETDLGEKVYLINNSENLGQGRALNQGVAWAINQGYQWALLLDQDSELSSSMVENLIRAYQSCLFRGKVKMLGSNCTYKNIEVVKYNKECKDNLYFERDVIQMSGNLLSLSAYQKIGPFREEFFIDSTDADYCLRLRKNGFKIIVACQAQMKHSVGEGAKMRSFFGRKFLVTNHSPERCYYMTRNGLILVKEYLFREPHWALRRIVWYFFVKPGLIIFFEGNKLQKLKSMFIGLIHACFYNHTLSQ